MKVKIEVDKNRIKLTFENGEEINIYGHYGEGCGVNLKDSRGYNYNFDTDGDIKKGELETNL